MIQATVQQSVRPVVTGAQQKVSALLRHLRTTQIDSSLFRGESVDPGWGRVYGGQTMAQGMDAAVQTVSAGRVLHSMNATFPRPGSVESPIDYSVASLGDGRSFSTRTVTGSQEGKIIFSMTASFATNDDRTSPFEHQDPALGPFSPRCADPESVPTSQERLAGVNFPNEHLTRTYSAEEAPFEYRPRPYRSPMEKPERDKYAPRSSAFFRLARGAAIPDDANLHLKVAAYISDWELLATAVRPYAVALWSPELQFVTLSHAIVFHRPFDLKVDGPDEHYLEFVKRGTATTNGRGFVIGEIFDASSGLLLATATQEGVVRPRPHRTNKN